MSKVEWKGGVGRVTLPMILCLIVIFSACLLLIYGLAETIPHLIAVETGQMISEDEYYERYHAPDWVYYGKYGDCYASLSKEGISIHSSETVGGLKFEYETQSKIRIFYGRRFYSLKAAYENGYLTDDVLYSIYSYHTDVIDFAEKMKLDINFDIIPVRLYEYEVRNIIYSYYSQNKALYKNGFDRGWSVDCLLKADDVYAIFLDCTEWGETLDGRKEIVNDLVFEYPTGRTAQIYYKGDFMKFKEAYERGILSDEMLTELYESFYANYDIVVRNRYYFRGER